MAKRAKKAKSRNLALTEAGGVPTAVVCPHPKVCANGKACVKKSVAAGMATHTVLSHNVTEHKSNGALPEGHSVPVPAPETITIGEAMRRAVEDLGEVTIDNDLAPDQMRQLAEVYEDVTRRQAAWNAKNDEAKVAKKALESATNLLLEKVRAFTHPIALPLFDKTQAEADLELMTDEPAGEPTADEASA